MKNSPYLSQRTRNAALKAIDDLPTDVLLNAMRQMPLSEFRRKELDESYGKDLQEHRKVFQMDDKPKPEAKPMDPARLLAGMSYAKAPAGPSGGDVSAPKLTARSDAPTQGDPLGAYKVAKPDLPEGGGPIYKGFKIDGSAGDGTAQSEVG